ncbi:MAG: hypothetical protein Q9162_005920 [Coniocarpon cinnabarinum]
MNKPPVQPPNDRILSACTAVIRTKFSKSERLAESCASCEWRWFRCRALAVAAGVVDVEGRELEVLRGAMEARGWEGAWEFDIVDVDGELDELSEWKYGELRDVGRQGLHPSQRTR